MPYPIQSDPSPSTATFRELSSFIEALSGPRLYLTPNTIPGSPEVLAEDIASAEEDIACWHKSVLDARVEIAQLENRILSDLSDISFAEGKLAVLKQRMALVDRRQQQVKDFPFPERRSVVSEYAETVLRDLAVRQ